MQLTTWEVGGSKPWMTCIKGPDIAQCRGTQLHPAVWWRDGVIVSFELREVKRFQLIAIHPLLIFYTSQSGFQND